VSKIDAYLPRLEGLACACDCCGRGWLVPWMKKISLVDNDDQYFVLVVRDSAWISLALRGFV
jgi:hypothetical protein